MRTDAVTPAKTQRLRPPDRGACDADGIAPHPARRRVRVADAAPVTEREGWCQRESLPAALRAWEALSAYERGLFTDRGVEPNLAVLQVVRRHGRQAHCGHCDHVVSPVVEVRVARGTAFVCLGCLDEGRRGRRLDAMVFAVGRTRPSHRR